MNKNIKAIIFDWGGVLVEQITKKMTKEISVRYNIEEKAVLEAYDKNLHDYEKGIMQSEDFWNEFCSSLHQRLSQEIVKNILAAAEIEKPEMLELCKKLKKKYKVAILSNNNELMVEFIRQNFDLSYFDSVIFSYEVGMLKPDSEIYLLCARQLKLKPHECLFVDDKEKNVKAARTAGMEGIIFKDYVQFKKELNEHINL
jgi:epoxide hydrolase-like predicted phosphatase